LVTSAPNILYLKDTDGDWQADHQEILFTGFFENNSEAQITNLRYSVDNWIYAANHGQAGEVTFTRQPDAKPLAMSGGDFRFRLDKEEFELTSGPAQFGHAINDWGHRFITQNTIHIRHAVMPARYIDGHDHLPASSASVNISDHDLEMFQDTPPPYWRAERTRRRQLQYQEQGLDRIEYAEDHFTGASGGTVYTGDAFPQEYHGNIFTGDVAGNLIHRDVLIPDQENPTYTASRHASEMEKEFLSSTDPWFRPANFTIGPDGYLYVIDMYRQHIETPLSIPEDLKEDMDFLNGIDKGRIYRIKPIGTSAQSANPNLKIMESAQLVELLTHPNQWWRLQSQRLLLERQDLSVAKKVEQIFKEHQDARGRLHALYVLEGLGKLDPNHVQVAMQDAHPALREHGVILGERFPEMLPSIIECSRDSSARVAFQAALSLGKFPNQPEIQTALVDLIEQKGQNPWFRAAVLSSEAGSSYNLVEILSEEKAFFTGKEDWKVDFMEGLSFAITSRNPPSEVNKYLALLDELDPIWQKAGTSGIMNAGKKQGSTELKALIENITNEKQSNIALQQLTAYYAK